MAMKRRIKNRWNNIILIFRMMLRYWHYMLAGFVCMLLFALFNGVSVTLVIPVFDYVFKPDKVNLLYTDFSSFLVALGEMLKQHISYSGGFLPAIQNYGALLEDAKMLMLKTEYLTIL